ncbi:hypothetical protein SAMN04487974_1045 [Pelagibacterium luteolum]|uniref:Uncharacterized protein n=1 Tax=Pelagibacterium luteolum TaxID=440168 RepID=A0A1G7VAW3_9HYPH|nr:hypothetical protein SAMN04487974_1045 [Pelagibacterium luteolum]
MHSATGFVESAALLVFAAFVLVTICSRIDVPSIVGYAPDGAFGMSDDAPIDFDLLDRLYAAVTNVERACLPTRAGASSIASRPSISRCRPQSRSLCATPWRTTRNESSC